MLQVLPALNAGGVERGTIEIAEALAAAGFRPSSPPPAAAWWRNWKRAAAGT
ncbi:hypothetical protein ACFQU7_21525 [Pseudoroseomonas wenyumeiae]